MTFRRLKNTALRLFMAADVLFLWLAVGTLLAFLLYKGLPAVTSRLFFGDTPMLDALLGRRAVWDGIWPACLGTACLMGLTVLLAVFPGVGCGLYLAEFASERKASAIRLVMDMLAGTPSIVMGLFGFTLILFLRNSFWPAANTSLLLAAVCLALLVLPVLTMSTCAALEALPQSLRITPAALGFTRRQATRYILLPAALPGIRSGVILALGRAAEDTAVIMLTGVVVNAGLPSGLGAKFEALSFSIFYTAAQYQDQDELRRAFGAALVLLVLASGLMVCARLLEQRYRLRLRRKA